MEVERRLKALCNVIAPTSVRFLQFINSIINDGPSIDHFRDLLQRECLTAFKCCDICDHHTETCNSERCKRNESFIDSPCHFCDTRSSKCNKEILIEAIDVIVKFNDLVNSEMFMETCKQFSDEFDLGFDAFPRSKTWKLLWKLVDKAASVLDDFIKKTTLNYCEDYDNNKAWRRMILFLPLDSLLYVFKHLFKGM